MTRKVYWLWVPKTAGTSIWSALLLDHHRQRIKNPGQWDGKSEVLTFQHLPGSRVLETLGTLRWEFFIVAACRHPLDRLVSIYHAAIQDPNPLYRHPIHIGDGSFRAFVEDICRGGLPTPDALYGAGYANPQARWLCDDHGKLIPDLLLRYENLAEDWYHLHRLLDVPSCPLPHANASRHATWQRLYDPDLTALATEFYRDDFTKLGYIPEVRG